jgi:amidohydrolase
MKLVDDILASQAEIASIRRDLHAHPELRYEEHRTSDVVAAKLTEWGIPILRGLGGTGVVGTLKNGTGRKSIGLRADMDALPIQEANTFNHASKNAGKMHACGHDGHTAMLLAAAKHLAKHRQFDGTVHFIFQPAEEGGAGAKKMIEDGLFEKCPVDAVFGMHNFPGIAAGSFAVCDGPIMASSSEFEILIDGIGSHAALPHESVDPVMVACNLAQALQTIITRNKKPADTAVISITQIHAGDAYNVVPDRAILRGTVRTFTVAVLDLIEKRFREIVEQLPKAFGATAQLRFHRNYPPTVNHSKETEFARSVMRDLVGEAQTLEFEPTMGGEDFSFMLLAKPGCYNIIGNGGGDHRTHGHGLGPCSLHNPSYDFNDEVIPLGASYWVRLTEKFLTA